MRCPNCNKEIAPGKFCVYCGTPLSTAGPSPEENAHTDDITASDFEEQEHPSLEDQVCDVHILESHDSVEKNLPFVKNEKKGKGILLAFLAVLVFLGAIKIREKLNMQDVLIETKAIVFESYGTEEFGKVAYRALKEIEWSIEKTDNRNYTVTAQGFSPDYRCVIGITLDVHIYDNEIYAEISAVTNDGYTFYDLATLSDVMYTIYSYDKSSTANMSANMELPYISIVESYSIALRDQYDTITLENCNLNYMCRYHTFDEIGYALIDCTGDETAELIIGAIDGTPGFFFDMYTIADGNATLVARSGERSRYYLCTNGYLEHQGSAGADYSSAEYSEIVWEYVSDHLYVYPGPREFGTYGRYDYVTFDFQPLPPI